MVASGITWVAGSSAPTAVLAFAILTQVRENSEGALDDIKRVSFFHWASHSPLGHVVLFELFLGIPLFLMFLPSGGSASTTAWIVELFLVCFVGALLPAVGFWFTVSRPLIKRRDRG